jgi:ribonuclease HII
MTRSQRQPALFAAPADPALALATELGGVVAGLDEAGRGPLAGPVVAACVVMPAPLLELPDVLHALNDSKQLTERAREALFPHILAHAYVGIGVVEAAIIDEMNILRASLHAMAVAFDACQARLGQCGQQDDRRIVGAVLDGNQRAPLPSHVVQRPIVGGDACSVPIMAASVVAKVSRDRRMLHEAQQHPLYGFERHKGYGTAAHLRALQDHGPCVLHRMSFAPVAASVRR